MMIDSSNSKGLELQDGHEVWEEDATPVVAGQGDSEDKPGGSMGPKPGTSRGGGGRGGTGGSVRGLWRGYWQQTTRQAQPGRR